MRLSIIKIFLFFLAVLLGIFGQIFIVKLQIMIGLLLTCLTFIILFFIFFYKGEKNIKKIFDIKRIDFSFAFVVLALLLSISGIIIIKSRAELSLLFFVIAGILMFIIIYLDKSLFETYGKINYKQIKIDKWEKWFLIILLIWISTTRFYKLNDFPPGVHGHEAIIVSNCEEFSRGKFVWHMGAGAEWPTTTAYQGLFFAKIFGWNIGSFRIEGAIWGILSIIAFYFLTRQLISPISAAFATVLYSSNFTHLLISRNFMASTILLVSPVLGLYFLIRGINKRKFYDFLISGLAIGLSLHGYMPGRIVPFVFLAWLLYLILFDKKSLPSISNFIWLVIGFIMTSGYIIFMAFKEPNIYWEYLKSVNPNQNGNSFLGYIKIFLDNLPLHAGMFHIKGDCDVSFHIAYEPILDQISGALFPIGIFVSLLFFFRPIPVFFIGLFIAGMLPSMLGGGCSPQPNIRRMIIALPAIYMLIAFAFDIIINIIKKFKNKMLFYFFIIITIISSIFSMSKVIYDYFYRFNNYPPHLVEVAHHIYIAGKEIRKYANLFKDIKIEATQNIFSNSSTVILIPKEIKYSIIKEPEEFLFSDSKINKLVFLDPFLESIKDLINILIPESKIEVFKMKNNIFINDDRNLKRYVDPYNPDVYIIKTYIPSESLQQFHKILCKVDNEILLVDLDSDVLKKKFLNRNVELFFGFYNMKKYEDIKIILGDNYKWKIKINNREIKPGNAIILERGVNYLNLKGTITENFKLIMESNGQNLLSPENIFASEKPYGLKLHYTKGVKTWDKKPEIIKNSLFYPKRFYDVTDLPVPFCVKFQGILKPAKTAKYKFRTESKSPCRIYIDDKIVFSNFEENNQELEFELDSSKGYNLTVDFQVEGGEIDRTFLIYYRTKDMYNWDMLPANWVYLY